MTTIHDVAREADVGVGTVSRVLSGGHRVAPATRAKVEATIARLGYRPRSAAQALSRGRTNLIELVLPLVTRHFYVEVLSGVAAALADADFGLRISIVATQEERARVFARMGDPRRADGVLLVSLAPPAELAARATTPLVGIDVVHPALPSIAVDHAAAMRAVVQHLTALGHRRIALIDRPDDPFAVEIATERGDGFVQAMTARGLDPAVQSIAYSPEAGSAAVRDLLTRPTPPTAIVTGSDTQAIGVIAGLRQQGVRIPEEISVVGYHDIELAAYLGLTTMRVPMAAMGRQGAERLLAQLRGEAADHSTVRLPARLVVRRTTAAAPRGDA
ncbi:MAG TPA: LacI family DNA-binding transcriptional regulator [Thermomicrobiales bacterium]|nr:LacI family DNA-binding transcriptional regulator [Thermomicrobiales bacterium]